jgi:hypothetical protein
LSFARHLQRDARREIVAEPRLVEGNRQLLSRMEHKVAGAFARIWGEQSAVPANDGRGQTDYAGVVTFEG